MRPNADHATPISTLTTIAGLAIAIGCTPLRAQSDPLESPFSSAQSFDVLEGAGLAWNMAGRQLRGFMGANAAFAGDLNGDGVDDAIFGAFGVDVGGKDRAGEAYVVFGQAGGPTVRSVTALDGTNGFTFQGGAADDTLGAVSGAGDLNGDGIDDVIIGAAGADPSGSRSGETYVVFGRADGFPATLSPDDLDGTNGFRLPGVGAGDFSGIAVAGIGDINNDGIDDAVIAAQEAQLGRFPTAYVLFGTRDGFDAVVPLADVAGPRGFRLLPDQIGSLRVAVAGAGDVNGDGIADLIMGLGSPVTYVVFGRDGGFPDAVSGADLDGTNGFTITSDSGDGAGLAVASAGDLNGDGFDDVAIGARYAGRKGDGIAYQGYAYVVFGKGDPFEPQVSLGALDGTDGFRMEGATSEDMAGASLAPAGDVNGDGFDDLAVGAPFRGYSYTCYYCGGYSAGRGAAYVIYGRDTGFDAVIDLNQVSSSSVIRFDGPSNSQMATSLAGGGDLNGDGRPDILLGAVDGLAFGTEGLGAGMAIYGRGEGDPCLADLDGDGELTIFDFLGFQIFFDLMDPRADFDGDGEFTLFDFLEFQNAFDAGCE